VSSGQAVLARFKEQGKTEALGSMRRFLKMILLLAVFLGGYYVGQLPDSPDIFGGAANAYHRVDKTATRISTKARVENISLTEAALACLFDTATEDGNR
jgi:hypothetical protein